MIVIKTNIVITNIVILWVGQVSGQDTKNKVQN